jgi:hypothetical protein
MTIPGFALDAALDRALVPVGVAGGERLLPDPEWPVPPRGWHLWAAALPDPGSRRSPSDAASREPGHGEVDVTGDDETRPFVEADDTAFTLPSRPAHAPRDRVDLLGGRGRRLPEGSGLGFTLMAALVVLGTLIGGPTGGLVVLGVSTLLAASAAIVLGRLTLHHVGGARGGGVLLVVAACALIVGSLDAAARRLDAPQHDVSVPVPVSSPAASDLVSTPTASTAVTGSTHRESTELGTELTTELGIVPSVTGTLLPHDAPPSASMPSDRRATPATAAARAADVAGGGATRARPSSAPVAPSLPVLPTDAFAPRLPALDGLATPLEPLEPLASTPVGGVGNAAKNTVQQRANHGAEVLVENLSGNAAGLGAATARPAAGDVLAAHPAR